MKKSFVDLDLGEYAKFDGLWYACAPDPVPNDNPHCLDKYYANLSAHDIVEHDDGTITVSPSIKITVSCGDKELIWHGYLKHGVWERLADSNV